jgi:hypothetical protein
MSGKMDGFQSKLTAFSDRVLRSLTPLVSREYASEVKTLVLGKQNHFGPHSQSLRLSNKQ